jgi:putative sigma-54 modulation protein
MQITTTARHFELTPALREHIEDRHQKLVRYFGQLITSHVTLTVEKHQHLAEISIHANGVDFNGRGKSEDMYVSVDLAVDRLERQIKKHKDRLRNHKGKASLSEGLAVPEEPVSDEETDQ